MTLTFDDESTVTAPDCDHAVPADAWSDDHHCEVEFDAARWLQTATLDAVVELASDGWERGYGADAVALHSQEWDDGCKILQDYVTAYNAAAELKNKDVIGFECRVDKHRALSWLSSNCKDVYAELKARGLT